MPATKSQAILIPVGTSNPPSAAVPSRGAIDVRTADSLMLTVKLTNGSIGPNAQAAARVMISHNPGTTPALGPPGAEWKLFDQFGGGVAANESTERVYRFGQAIQHVQVDVSGNNGQAVLCEALATVVTNS